MPVTRDTLESLRIERADEPQGRRRWPVVVAVAALALVALAVSWWVLGRTRAHEVTVAVAAAASPAGGGADVALNASGYVTARRRATVSSEVTGRVTEVLVEEGMEVREGQVLARLDPTSVEGGLALSRARLGAAQSALGETAARLEEARRTLDRVRALHADGIASQADLDVAEAQAESLEARHELERRQIEVARREVGVRRIDLDDTVIRAPFSGVAISKDAQPGEMVSPVSAGGGFTRTGICTIVDMSSLEIEVDVGESYIDRVRPRQRVEAVLDAYPDWKIPGSVITTIPAADRQKATVRVRIAFDRLDPRILPDMGVKVAFLTPSTPGAVQASRTVSIPRAAIRRDGDREVVFVVRDGRAERRAVTTRRGDADPAQVTSGLSAGERVVLEAPAELADGDEVRVRAG